MEVVTGVISIWLRVLQWAVDELQSTVHDAPIHANARVSPVREQEHLRDNDEDMEVQQAPAPRSLAPLQPPQPRGTKRRADTTPNESRAPKRQLRSTAVQKANRHQPSLQPEGRYQVNADELEPVSAELDPLVATDRMDTRPESVTNIAELSKVIVRSRGLGEVWGIMDEWSLRDVRTGKDVPPGLGWMFGEVFLCGKARQYVSNPLTGASGGALSEEQREWYRGEPMDTCTDPLLQIRFTAGTKHKWRGLWAVVPRVGKERPWESWILLRYPSDKYRELTVNFYQCIAQAEAIVDICADLGYNKEVTDEDELVAWREKGVEQFDKLRDDSLRKLFGIENVEDYPFTVDSFFNAATWLWCHNDSSILSPDSTYDPAFAPLFFQSLADAAKVLPEAAHNVGFLANALRTYPESKIDRGWCTMEFSEQYPGRTYKDSRLSDPLEVDARDKGNPGGESDDDDDFVLGQKVDMPPFRLRIPGDHKWMSLKSLGFNAKSIKRSLYTQKCHEAPRPQDVETPPLSASTILPPNDKGKGAAQKK